MSACQVTGTFYLPASLTVDPEPATGVRLMVMYGTSDGQVLHSTAKTYISDVNGELEFFVPRLATIWLWAGAQGFGRRQTGVAVVVPDSETGVLEIINSVPVITATGPLTAYFLLLQDGGHLLFQDGGRFQLQD